MLYHRHNRFLSSSAGITLVEVLVTVAIIALLMGILLPLMGNAKKQAKVTATTSLLRSIGDALEQYFLDHKMYPSSGYYNGDTYQQAYGSNGIPENRGSCLLAQGLMGYLPEARDGGAPSGYGGIAGTYPYGFRLRRDSSNPSKGMGRLYGPYIQPANNHYRINDTNANTRERDHCFIDPFGNEILYYRATLTVANPERVFGEPSKSFFSADDNSAAKNANGSALISPTQGPPELYKLLGLSGKIYGEGANQVNGNELVYKNGQLRNEDNPATMLLGRDSFLLISAGPDGLYFTGPNKKEFVVDDIIVSKP